LTSDASRQPYHEELLYRLLHECFGDIDEDTLGQLWPRLTWTELAGGDALVRQGEPGDAMYLLVSGRLRAYVQGEAETAQLVGEITRGELVGEMSLLTDEPRRATVLAVRDSLLVRLAKADFDALMTRQPAVARVLTRQVVHRLTAPRQRALYPRPTTVALLPASDGLSLPGLALALAEQLSAFGRVEVVDAARVQDALFSSDATLGPQALTDMPRRISLLLDRIEARAEFVLLVADPEPTAWTARCCRDADELLVLVDATQPPRLHAIERLCLMNRASDTEAAEILVLLQPDDQLSPRGTRAWLDRRPVADHLHVRPGRAADLARLARYLNRSSVALVLAGGGARGLAHLGVWRALQEHGVEIDCVGGTSVGAVMATYVAADRPLDAAMANARRAFETRPTGDYNPWPWLSVFRGQRLRRILEAAVVDLLGFDADLEDLWKPHFAIATNYSQARAEVLRRGRLVKVLLASTSIPGALPPVLHEGELLCDGGSFNNFPVDVMRSQRGVGTVIGIDLNARQPLKVDLDELPSHWALFIDWWRRPRRRRYRLPSLPTYLMTVMVLNSLSHSRQSKAQTDLYFNPPLVGVGLLQWKRFDRIVRLGYDHAQTVLKTWPPAPSGPSEPTLVDVEMP
jgi:NTE family protein